MTDFSFSLKEKLGGVQVGFNSRRLHHLEFRSGTASVLRTANVVSANEFQGFLKETVKV